MEEEKTYEIVGWIRPSRNPEVLRVVHKKNSLGIISKATMQRVFDNKARACPIRTTVEETKQEETVGQAAGIVSTENRIDKLEQAIKAHEAEMQYLREKIATHIAKDVFKK